MRSELLLPSLSLASGYRSLFKIKLPSCFGSDMQLSWRLSSFPSDWRGEENEEGGSCQEETRTRGLSLMLRVRVLLLFLYRHRHSLNNWLCFRWPNSRRWRSLHVKCSTQRLTSTPSLMRRYNIKKRRNLGSSMLLFKSLEIRNILTFVYFPRAGFPHSWCGREGAEQRASQEAAKALRSPGKVTQWVSGEEPEWQLIVFLTHLRRPSFTAHRSSPYLLFHNSGGWRGQGVFFFYYRVYNKELTHLNRVPYLATIWFYHPPLSHSFSSQIRNSLLSPANLWPFSCSVLQLHYFVLKQIVNHLIVAVLMEQFFWPVKAIFAFFCFFVVCRGQNHLQAAGLFILVTDKEMLFTLITEVKVNLLS